MTETKTPPKFALVKLKRSYVPVGGYLIDGNETTPPERPKVADKLLKGTLVELQVDEARRLIQLGKADRADEL